MIFSAFSHLPGSSTYLSSLSRSGSDEPHVIFLDVHQVVIAGVQPHHPDELILGLVVAAIDMASFMQKPRTRIRPDKPPEAS